MKTKITLGKSVRIDLRRLVSVDRPTGVCINIDTPLWRVSKYEIPESLCELPYKSIKIPVSSDRTLVSVESCCPGDI